MSQKKIIFFIIVGIVLLALIAGVLYLSNQKQTQKASGNLVVWINEGTTESFNKLITGFHEADPENKKISITVEKKTSNPDNYRTTLLNTLADDEWPDIFMLQRGEDAILEGRLTQIPSEVLSISEFENRFDDVFRDLIITDNSVKPATHALLGIPLGYETLGIFYNRSLLRTGAPRLWSEVEAFYRQFPNGIYPSNLWLSTAFVPNVSDVLPMFFAQEKAKNYADLDNLTTPFADYYAYGDLMVSDEVTETTYSQSDTLRRSETLMQENKRTTFDEFMRGNIALIVGYPSLVFELEKAKKRAGSQSVDDVILAERLPQFSDRSIENIAKYSYLGISKKTQYPDAAARFLAYLMTDDAQRIAMEVYPHLIPAQTEFHYAAQGKSFSSELSRIKLDNFIPQPTTKLTVFDYGIKSKFQSILDQNWDAFESRSELSTLGSRISRTIACEIAIYDGNSTQKDCE